MCLEVGGRGMGVGRGWGWGEGVGEGQQGRQLLHPEALPITVANITSMKM